MKKHFHREEKIMQGYLNLVQGKIQKADNWMQEYLVRVKVSRSASVESMLNLTDVLLKEACIREHIRIENTPSVYDMTQWLWNKNSSRQTIFPIEIKKLIDLLRHKRNAVPHHGRTEFSVSEIQLYTQILFTVLEWFYKSYYPEINIPEDLHVTSILEPLNHGNLTPKNEQEPLFEPLPLSGNQKPSRTAIRKYEAALIKEVQRIGYAENWDINSPNYLQIRVRVLKNNIFQENTTTLKKHLTSLLHRERRLDKRIFYKKSNALLLLGEPGAGKSIVMRKLVGDLITIKRRIIPPRLISHIPIYISLRDWDMNKTPTLESFIFNTLAQHQNDNISSFTKKHFKSLLERKRFFFLLDGFDEIPAILSSFQTSELINEVSQKLQKFIDDWGNRCLVASRKFKRPPEPFFTADETFYMQPVTEEDILKVRYGKYEFEKLRLIYNSPSLRELMKVPLTITFIKEYLDKGKHMPKSVAKLYEGIIDRRLHEARLEFEEEISKSEIIECAKCIASYEHDSELKKKYFGLNKSIDELRLLFPERQIKKAVRVLRNCRLVKSDGKRVVFIHRSIHDYFFAKHLIDTPFTLEKQYDIDNRNAYILYLEICSNNKKLQSIFDYCWQKAENIAKQDLPFEDIKFKEGLFYLLYIIDGFKGKIYQLEKKQEVIVSLIRVLLNGKKNLIAKKYALKCTQLLIPKLRVKIIEELFKAHKVQYNPYLSNTMIAITNLITSVGGKTQSFIQLYCMNKVEKEYFFRVSGFEFPTRKRPYIKTHINNQHYSFLCMQLYSTQKKYASNFTVKLWVIAVFRLSGFMIIVFLFFGSLYAIRDNQDIKLIQYLFYPLSFFAAVVPIYWAIKYLIIESLFSSMYTKNEYQNVSTEKYKTAMLSITIILGGMFFLLFLTDLIWNTKLINWHALGGVSILLGFLILYYSCGIRELAQFNHDRIVLRKNKILKAQKTITREALAELFNRFKTSHFRTKFMRHLKNNNTQIDPNSHWPDGKLPNIDDDEASGIIAEMEESLLGLSQY